ncbi:MAG: hypothetical protein WKF55_04795 [Gemmatimonadaceae bacterium]
MTECLNNGIRDVLPDLIHGHLGAPDRALILSHVDSCSACMEELTLLREVRATAPLAPAIDIDRIVTALPQPGRGYGSVSLLAGGGATNGAARESVPAYRLSHRTVWRVAAAAVIVVVGGYSILAGNPGAAGSRRAVPVAAARLPASPAAGVAEGTAGDIDGSDARGTASPAAPAGSRTVTTPLGGILSRTLELTLVGGVSELSDAHIERLMKELDELEGMPLSEPESATHTLENLEGEG